MKKTNLQQKNYNMGAKSYQLSLPLNYEVNIPEDDSVRLFNLIMEALDYTELYRTYSREGGKPTNDPKTLAKIVIYAYMEFIYSSRKIERACRRDINFMWLLNGDPVPNHSTISRFRKAPEILRKYQQRKGCIITDEPIHSVRGRSGF